MKNYLLALPMKVYYIVLAAMCMIWTIAYVIIAAHEKRSNLQKCWKIINMIFAAATAALILYMTLLSRKELSGRDVMLHPFANIIKAFEFPPYQREKLLNVFAFVPIGITMCGGLCGSVKKRTAITIFVGFLLSFTIEVCQFIFRLGLMEIDDVIVNTFGTILGVVIFLIAESVALINRKIKEKS